MVIFLLACAVPPVETSVPDPVATLTRMSLDLRGVRPSLDELDAVERDAGALDTLRETFLADARFGTQVRDLWSQVYRTRLDAWPRSGADYRLDDEAAFAAAVSEEPLRVLAEVAMNDLPWTTIVTADWTMADEVLARSWPVAYPDGASGWQRARYTDGRPAAGVIVANALYWRYMTTRENGNRGRANALARILVCNDFMTRTIAFDRSVGLDDPDLVSEALRTNPSCVSCHAGLDPIAGYLGGFYWSKKAAVVEMTYYHPEREQVWRTTTGVAPAWFGEPASGLIDLPAQIAADPAFVECAVEQATAFFLQRETNLDDTERLALHREAFLAGDLTLRALVRSILADEAWLPGSATKLTSPYQLADSVEALTGFRWTDDGYDVLGAPDLGLLLLAGGMDGEFASLPAREPSTTVVLVQERLAQAAAAYAEAADAPVVDWDATADTAAVVALHRRVLGRRPTDAEVSDLLALWEQAAALSDGRTAWGTVLTVLLRDPAFLLY